MISIIENNTKATPANVSNLRAVSALILNNDWSPASFKNNYRKLSNFEKADTIGLDIDGGCSLDDAKQLFADYAHVIATTRNHQKEKNGVTTDRFRVLLKLEAPITDAEIYKATYLELMKQFPFLDKACSDASRMFYKSDTIVSVREGGRLVSTAKRGRLAKSTREFISSGAPDGQWNPTLYKATKDMQQNGFSREEILSSFVQPTGYLDSRDMTTIDSALSRTPKHPPRIEIDNSVESWVGIWAEANYVRVFYNGMMSFNGEEVSYKSLIGRLMLDTARSNRKYPIQLLEAALNDMIERETRQIRKNYANAISFDGNTNNLPEQLIEAWEGKRNDLSAAVLRHFLWSVKRKLKGMPVSYHLMPVLYGKTGGGKSQAIQKLTEAIKEISIEKRLVSINDEREKFNFSKFFVIVFDEMAYASRTDVDALKNIITSDSVSYRILGTHNNYVGKNVATCIGTSNKEVITLINDPTSARRYYQVTCADRMDWDTINTFDYVALWRGIDETAPAPIYPHLTILQQEQEKIRSLSDVEMWLAYNVKLGEGETSGSDAHANYVEFCKNNGFRMKNINNFLVELGKVAERTRTNRKRLYIMTIISGGSDNETPTF